MPNAIFAKGREAWANGDVDWLQDDINAVLVDLDGLVIDTATMDVLADIPEPARVATATLTGKENVDGTLDADDTEFPEVEGDQVEALVIVQNTGNPSTSRLLIYFDTAESGDGIELVPNGGSITARWNPAGIATL